MDQMTFYHGTTLRDLDYLDVEKCSESSPFGRAIYLTTDPIVADCYSGKDGWIFEVAVLGDWGYTVNFDAPISEQTPKVRGILEAAPIGATRSVNGFQSCRDLLHQDYLTRERVNAFLRESGIWMLYGHLSGMESSGLMDRGIQYAVIDSDKVEIVRAHEIQELLRARTES